MSEATTLDSGGDSTLDTDRAVRERYEAAAQVREASLCCPVDYDPAYLEVIPKAVRDRDYGCGDPSRYGREGDHVLDLGSGGGKIDLYTKMHYTKSLI